MIFILLNSLYVEVDARIDPRADASIRPYGFRGGFVFILQPYFIQSLAASAMAVLMASAASSLSATADR